MSPVLGAIKHYQNNIEKYGGDEKRILHCIDKLDNLPVTVQHLQDTGVGRTVNALRKDHGEIGKASKALVAKWKLMVAEEEESEEEPQEIEEEDEVEGFNIPVRNESICGLVEWVSKENSIAIRESENDQRSHSNHSDSRPDGKRKYDERANDQSKKSKEDRYDSREMHVQKKSRKDSKISESVPYNSSHNSCDSDGNQSDQSSRNKTHELDEDSDMENKYTNYKHEKTKHKHSENGDSNKVKSSHHSRSKDRNHHRDKKPSADSQSDKHSSRSSKDSKDKQDRDSSKRHKHSDDKKDRHSSESRNSSDKKSSSSSSKSSSDYKKIKETSKSNNSKPLEKSHSSKPKDEKKDSKSRDEKKSIGSKHDGSKTEVKEIKDQSSKNKLSEVKESSSKKSKSDVKKEKRSEKLNDDGIDCESGASFAEALGMITPSPVKKKSAPSKDIPTKSSPDIKKTDIKSPSEKSEIKPITKPSSSSKQLDTSLLHPDYKLSPLPLLEISALPEISPNYKPRPPPKLLNSIHTNEEEALSTVMLNKNIRTKVYSGNRVYGAVPSLYEMCVIILQENIDALEYTGGVPYEILKPIVDKANPDQLFMLEHYNPYLMDDTDPLWQKHCEKKFRSQRRQELETWREMYMRCLDEQEAKLKSLTANIKLSLDKKMAPARFTKMAYVDGNVKPPRGIARKQAIHGTARVAVVSPAARVASLASGQVIKSVDMRGVPSSSDSSASKSSGFIKPKKAPLMQKALQLMKGRHKR